MILLTFSVTIKAENDVVSIKKGEAAPFAGILFTEDKANQVRIEVLEQQKLRYMVQSRDEKLGIFSTRIELKDEEIELLRKQNLRIYNQNKTNSSVGTIERIVWFGLGIMVTGAAVYGARGLSK